MKTLLIPTDGSPGARTAVRYGLYLARTLGVKITGLHVQNIQLLQSPVCGDPSGAVGLPLCPDLLPLIEQQTEERSREILRDFADLCRAAGETADTRTVPGIVAEVIIEESRAFDAILLARRSTEGDLLQGAVLGGTAETVARKAGKPVWVTPSIFREIESMALAYDGSPPADKALTLAADLAEKAAWPLTVLLVPEQATDGEAWIRRIEAALERRTLDWEPILLTGKADREILRFVQEGSVELLVMGGYGHNRLRELLLGSTTFSLIRKSPIPILLTR